MSAACTEKQCEEKSEAQPEEKPIPQRDWVPLIIEAKGPDGKYERLLRVSADGSIHLRGSLVGFDPEVAEAIERAVYPDGIDGLSVGTVYGVFIKSEAPPASSDQAEA